MDLAGGSTRAVDRVCGEARPSALDPRAFRCRRVVVRWNDRARARASPFAAADLLVRELPFSRCHRASASCASLARYDPAGSSAASATDVATAHRTMLRRDVAGARRSVRADARSDTTGIHPVGGTHCFLLVRCRRATDADSSRARRSRSLDSCSSCEAGSRHRRSRASSQPHPRRRSE